MVDYRLVDSVLISILPFSYFNITIRKYFGALDFYTDKRWILLNMFLKDILKHHLELWEFFFGHFIEKTLINNT